MKRSPSTSDTITGSTGIPVRTGSLGRFWGIIFTAQLGWSLPGAAQGILVQSLAARIAPTDKVALYATATTTGAVFAVIAIVLAGALSDRTTGRLGARVPWIVGGATVGSIGLVVAGVTGNAAGLVIGVAVYQLGLNAMLGAVGALLPDYLQDELLGRAGAAGGVGVLLGQVLGAIAGAALVSTPTAGLTTVPWCMLLAALVVAVALPRPLRRRIALPEQSLRQTLIGLRPPADRQFWLVFAGRFAFILALFMTLTYQLFIATDYLGRSETEAGHLVGAATIGFAISAAVATIVAGPLSDRVRRRKPFVIAAPLVVAAAVVPLLVAPSATAFLVFATTSGIAFGAYVAVDGALMVEILPDRAHVAKDLAFLSSANSLPLVVAPAVAGGLVATVGYHGTFIATIVAAAVGACLIVPVRRVR